MNWLSHVMFAVWLGGVGFFIPKLDDRPLGKWKDVGTYAYVTVVNWTPDSIPVGVIAPKVDRAIRLLGWVPANDSAYFRLPYADTDVLLLVNNAWVPLTVRDPSVHRVEVQPQ